LGIDLLNKQKQSKTNQTNPPRANKVSDMSIHLKPLNIERPPTARWKQTFGSKSDFKVAFLPNGNRITLFTGSDTSTNLRLTSIKKKQQLLSTSSLDSMDGHDNDDNDNDDEDNHNSDSEDDEEFQKDTEGRDTSVGYITRKMRSNVYSRPGSHDVYKAPPASYYLNDSMRFTRSNSSHVPTSTMNMSSDNLFCITGKGLRSPAQGGTSLPFCYPSSFVTTNGATARLTGTRHNDSFLPGLFLPSKTYSSK